MKASGTLGQNWTTRYTKTQRENQENLRGKACGGMMERDDGRTGLKEHKKGKEKDIRMGMEGT